MQHTECKTQALSTSSKVNDHGHVEQNHGKWWNVEIRTSSQVHNTLSTCQIHKP